MASSVLVSDIAKLLENEGGAELYRRRSEFCDILGFREPRQGQLMIQLENGSMSILKFYKDIICDWVQRIGLDANTGELYKQLLTIDMKYCAEQLRKHFAEMPIAITMETGEIRGSKNADRQLLFYKKSILLNFIGREEELKILTTFISSNGHHGIVISGLGGIGKTELTKNFIKIINNSIPMNVIWLAGESLQSLQQSLQKLCRHIEISVTDTTGHHLSISKLTKNIQKTVHLNFRGKILIVIDNVDEIFEEFKHFMHRLIEFDWDVFIVVTSRRRDILPGALELLDVKEFTLENGMNFVKLVLDLEESVNSDVKELCEKLQNFPLALQQATAYIIQQRHQSLKGKDYNVKDYLNQLNQNAASTLNLKLNLTGYPQSTIDVWNLTLTKIATDYGESGRISFRILNIVSVLSPDYISMSFLYKAYPQFYSENINEEELSKSLKLLLNFNLIGSNNYIINVHRLVQLTQRLRLNTDGHLIQILQHFWASFDSGNYNNDDMVQILSIWHHTTQNRSLLETFIQIPAYVSALLENLGMQNELLHFATTNRDLLVQILDENDELFIKVELYIVIGLSQNGKYEEALQSAKALHEKTIPVLSENNPTTWRVSNLVAAGLALLDRNEEALDWFKRILHSRIKTNGETHPTTMAVKHNIAWVMNKLGQTKAAMELYYELIQWSKENTDDKHPDAFTIRHNMAVCLFRQEQYLEAHILLEYVSKMREEYLGVEKSDTLSTKYWLAATLDKLGNRGAAQQLFKSVLLSQEKVLGLDHPDTIITRREVLMKTT